MKRLIYILLAIPFIFGCEREPYADFFVSSDVAEVGDIIYFTNNSYDADSYEWDFGDGTVSYGFNAEHIYTASGTYHVTLTAFNGNKSFSRARIVIDVLFPTSLEVTVLEYYDEYPVKDASVILYNNLDDWYDEYNPLVEGWTNQYGRVSFSHLHTQHYFIDVWEDYHNNWQLAEEDIAWIETDRLYANEMNYFIAYVDYAPPVLKSEGRADKSLENMKLMKLERLGERAYENKLEEIKKHIDQRKEEYKNEEIHQQPIVPEEIKK